MESLTSRCCEASEVKPTVAAAKPINPPYRKELKIQAIIKKNRNKIQSNPAQRKQNLAVIGLRGEGVFRGQQVNHRRNLIMISGGRKRLHDSFHLQRTPENSHY